MIRVVGTSFVVGAAMLAGGLALASTAMADDDIRTWSEELRGGQGIVYVSRDRNRIEVCDTEVDGRGVYAEYHWVRPDGTEARNVTLRDTNGAEAGCGVDYHLAPGSRITEFRVCLRESGRAATDFCSRWRIVP